MPILNTGFDPSRQPQPDERATAPNSLLDHALAYAAIGWHVFPLQSTGQFGACSCTNSACKVAGKHPRTGHGVNDATTDEQTIRAWWARWPEANIGIACGSRSGLVVLDVDPRNGGHRTLDDMLTLHGALPETVTVATGGGGTHYYFRRAGYSATYHSRDQGIDVQGDGSYVVAPPSKTASPYEFTDCSSPFEDGVLPVDPPEWIAKLATRAEPPPDTRRGPSQPLTKMRPFDLRCAREALDVLAQTDAPVARDSWIKVGMALHSTETIEAFELWDAWSQTCPDKYDRNESLKQWRSFRADRAGGITFATLVDMAQGFGWSPPVETVRVTEQSTAAEGSTARPDYPQELLRAPGILQPFVDHVNAINRKQQPKLSVAAAVALACTIMSRRYAWRGSRSSVYQLVIAGTGEGKDAGRQAIKGVLYPITDQHEHLAGEEFKSGSAVMSAVARHPNSIALIDEYGHYLAGINSKNASAHSREIAPKLMKMFSSTNSVMLGDEYADQKLNKRTDIEYPCLSIYGTTTMTKITDGLSVDQIEDGFLNRHILVLGDDDARRNPSPDYDAVPPQRVIEWAKRAIAWTPPGSNGLVGIASNPIKLGEEAGVERLMQEFCDFADRRVREANARRSGVGGVWVRAYELVTRLCVALAGAECTFDGGDAPRVSVAACRWAIAYVTHSAESLVELAMSEVGASEHEKAVRRALEVVRKAGAQGITKNLLIQSVAALKRSGSESFRKAVLTDLVDLHDVVEAMLAGGSRGPKPKVFIHPDFVTEVT